MEINIFKKRWNNAVMEDKCWIDPYQKRPAVSFVFGDLTLVTFCNSQEEAKKLSNAREANLQSLNSLKDANKTLREDLDKMKIEVSTARHEATSAKKEVSIKKTELDRLKPELERIKKERLDLMTTVKTYPQNYEVAKEEGVKQFKGSEEMQGTLKLLMGPAMANGYTRAVGDVKQLVPDLDINKLATKNLYAPGIDAIYTSQAAELFAGENIAKKYLSPAQPASHTTPSTSTPPPSDKAST